MDFATDLVYKFESQKLIDQLSNLIDLPIYIFNSLNDSGINPFGGQVNSKFYRSLGSKPFD